MVVIDATNLLLFLRPDTPVPPDDSGVPIDRPRDRIEYLIKRLDKANTKVIIPTPALSEALVRIGAAAVEEVTQQLQNFAVFKIEPFDIRAAIEVALMTKHAIAGGNKRNAAADTWAKIKYDRQIVAIAKTCGADTIYSDDKGLANFAKQAGLKVVRLCDLPLPPEQQIEMALTGAAEGSLQAPEEDDEGEDEG